MKRAAVAALLLTMSVAHGKLTVAPAAAVAAEKAGSGSGTRPGFSIHVSDGDWGNAQPAEIESLLNAITAEMLTHFPGRQLAPIEIFPTSRRPVVLYQKGPQNQYQVYLAAKGRHWGEYIYEFSHELFHILANYENHALSGKGRHLWFEEMLSEAASLYNLKRLSAAWKIAVPDKEWSSYVPALNRFTQRALNEPHRRLPENTSLAEWFRDHEESLLGNPHLRAKNEMVAMVFLPLLEQNRDWSAIGFLNPPIEQSPASFQEYLADWYKNTPESNRDFVIHALNLFEFHLPPARTTASIKPTHRDSMPAESGAAEMSAIATRTAR